MKCTGVLNIRGEQFPCDQEPPHFGWACSSKEAGAIWQSEWPPRYGKLHWRESND
jgi:hypothetical protein